MGQGGYLTLVNATKRSWNREAIPGGIDMVAWADSLPLVIEAGKLFLGRTRGGHMLMMP